MNRSYSLKYYLFLLICSVMLTTGCRKDPAPANAEQEIIFTPNPSAKIKGMYLLNEGNMNSNKASLDYVDFINGVYKRNIYGEANPDVTKGLGDAANAIAVYGSKLYIVVNNSNKLEVLDVKTSKKIKQINITNCRSICFYKSKVYVSAYLGNVGNRNSINGTVSEIDTSSLAIDRTVEVGRQPEELAVAEGKLYVANSGGYSPPDYERTVSVIDLISFTEIKRIDVAINLHRLKADRYNNIYVSSRGDFYNKPSGLFMIDTKTDQVKKDFGLAAGNLWINGDSMYVYSSEWNYLQSKNLITYSLINTREQTVLSSELIKDGTEKKISIPFGIAVNAETNDFFVTDAKDYVTPGTLYCFDKAGFKKWSVTTGDLPGHFAFVY